MLHGLTYVLLVLSTAGKWLWKSSASIADWSVSPYSSVSFHSVYFEALFYYKHLGLLYSLEKLAPLLQKKTLFLSGNVLAFEIYLVWLDYNYLAFFDWG